MNGLVEVIPGIINLFSELQIFIEIYPIQILAGFGSSERGCTL
jgi:hypothetical protein